MKILTFSDGTTLNVTDTSTPSDVVMVFSSKAEAGETWGLFTVESMKSGTLNRYNARSLVNTTRVG